MLGCLNGRHAAFNAWHAQTVRLELLIYARDTQRTTNQIKYSHMRTIERVIELAFISLFVAAFTFVLVMACTGHVYASHTGLG